jgi:hypothetical protein
MKNLVTTFFVILLGISNIIGQSLVLEWQSPDNVSIVYEALNIFETQKEIIDMNNDGHPEIVLEGNDNSIKVYDILTNQLIWEYQFAFSPNFQCFANVTDETSKELIIKDYPDVFMVNTTNYNIELVGTQNSSRNVRAYDIDQDGKDELILDYYNEDRLEIWGDGSPNYVKKSEIFPSSIKLSQNYPNPFNPSTNIKYYLNKSGYVEIKIYDVQGQLVAELVNEFKNIGNYEVIWEAEGFSSGRYFYQLILDGENVETKKMILLK